MGRSLKLDAGEEAPVVYEITVRAEPDVRDAFTGFMIEQHVPDLLKTGHFSSASIARCDGELRISYIARSRADLQKYLNDHAPRLRAEVLERFPDGFQIERREWELVGVVVPD